MAHIKGYQLIRNDRKDRRAGGVAIYLQSHLKYKILAQSTNSARDFFAEYIICEVVINSHNKLFVAVVYRPPNTPFYKGTSFLQTISNLSQDYSNKLILGDFNSNMLTVNPQSSIIKIFIQENNLYLIRHGITHIKNESSSHVDLCIVDANDLVISK